MSNDNSKVPMQATPHGTLLEQIMDPCQPKSEREWAASREIERLNAECERHIQEVDASREAIERKSAEIERLKALNNENEYAAQVAEEVLLLATITMFDEGGSEVTIKGVNNAALWHELSAHIYNALRIMHPEEKP